MQPEHIRAWEAVHSSAQPSVQTSAVAKDLPPIITASPPVIRLVTTTGILTLSTRNKPTSCIHETELVYKVKQRTVAMIANVGLLCKLYLENRTQVISLRI